MKISNVFCKRCRAKHGLHWGGRFEHLHGDINKPVIMEQAKTSMGCVAKAGYVCQVWKTIYCLREAGEVWGNTIHDRLVSRRIYLSKRIHLCNFIIKVQVLSISYW